MALITNSDQLNTAFVPAAGDFIVQVTAGSVNLQRRNVTAAAWANVAPLSNQGYVVQNPVAGAEYRFLSLDGSPVVRADQ
jgi:hypothetical protein